MSFDALILALNDVTDLQSLNSFYLCQELLDSGRIDDRIDKNALLSFLVAITFHLDQFPPSSMLSMCNCVLEFSDSPVIDSLCLNILSKTKFILSRKLRENSELFPDSSVSRTFERVSRKECHEVQRFSSYIPRETAILVPILHNPVIVDIPSCMQSETHGICIPEYVDGYDYSMNANEICVVLFSIQTKNPPLLQSAIQKMRLDSLNEDSKIDIIVRLTSTSDPNFEFISCLTTSLFLSELKSLQIPISRSFHQFLMSSTLPPTVIFNSLVIQLLSSTFELNSHQVSLLTQISKNILTASHNHTLIDILCNNPLFHITDCVLPFLSSLSLDVNLNLKILSRLVTSPMMDVKLNSIHFSKCLYTIIKKTDLSSHSTIHRALIAMIQTSPLIHTSLRPSLMQLLTI